MDNRVGPKGQDANGANVGPDNADVGGVDPGVVAGIPVDGVQCGARSRRWPPRPESPSACTPTGSDAAQLREEGVDIGIISKQLGQGSIPTTARYLDHIAPMAVIEAMRSRSWSA